VYAYYNLKALIDRYGSHTAVIYPSGYSRLSSESLAEMEKEAEEMLEKQNYIQACEKYYKISEEIVKALSEHYAPRVMAEVFRRTKEGKTPWTILLLNKAVDEIIENIKWKDTAFESIFRDSWIAAVALHRWGFHDFELTPSSIMHEVKKVRGMIKLVEGILRRLEGHSGTTVSQAPF
jgi:hypothetical protein